MITGDQRTDIILLIAAGLLVVLVISMLFRSGPVQGPELPVLCLQCHECVHPKTVRPGPRVVAILLWCFGIIPGLFYELLLRAHTKKVCPRCNSEQFVPLDSARAQEILK